MKHIVLMNTKGGVGKSSICKNLHQELMRTGSLVQGRDIDPQQHYARYFSELNQPIDAEYIIYDTAGIDCSENHHLLAAINNLESSDDAIIIIPVRPTDTDLFEVKEIVNILKSYNLENKSIFVLNSCVREKSKRVLIVKEALATYGVKVAKSVFTTKEGFDEVGETPNPKITNEVSRLIHEIIK